MAGTAWNSTFSAGTGLTFTNSNLTVANPTGSTATTRTIFSDSASKYYVEFVVNVRDGSSLLQFGVTTTSATNNSDIYWTVGGALVVLDGGTASVEVPGGSSTSLGAALVNGDVVGFAVDLANKVGWVRVNSGNWNNSGTANPATNTGGISFAAKSAPFFFGYTGYSGEQITARFLSASWTGTAPSGFGEFGVTTTFERPDSDVSAGSWTDQAGGTTNLYSVIDETTADDADYVRSSAIGVGGSDTLEVSLTDVADPLSSDNQTVRYRYWRSGTLATMTLTVSLRQGASTQIASWTHTNVGTSVLEAAQTLTSSQADAITDYSDLRLRFVASA